LVAVVAAGHPWTQRASVPLAELAVTPLVLREPGSGTREALEEALAAKGLGPPVTALELGSTAAVRMAVTTGSAPTVISGLAVESDLTNGALVAVEIPGLTITRRLRALWPTRRKLPPLAAALVQQLPAEAGPGTGTGADQAMS
ncbi:MAG: LysR substrate-binding domain-containing protein, partial [Actinomycetota bacterium]